MTWPLSSGQLVDDAGVNLGDSGGTTITAHADSDTKGDYAELVAATDFDADQVIVTIGPGSQSSLNAAIDIVVGGSGSEIVIAGDLYSKIRNEGLCNVYALPIRVPAGSRLAARMQANAGSTTCDVSVQLLSSGMLGPHGLSVVDALGFDAAGTQGTAVAPGATANTFTGWEEIIAATARPYRALIVTQHNDNSALASGLYVLEIGAGASLSEVTIIPGIRSAADTATDMLIPNTVGPFWLDIPAGTRLSFRAQESTASPSNRQAKCIVYGIE